MSDWRLREPYGNAYELPRTLNAQHQEHKIKHPLYGLLTSPVYRAFTGLGMAAQPAARLISTLIVVALLFAFVRLMTVCEIAPRLHLPMLMLVAAAPGIVVYAGLPESWTLSALLVVVAVLLHERWPDRRLMFGCFVGLTMLCNVSLLVLLALPVVACSQEGRGWQRTILCSAATGVSLTATFLGVLLLLGQFDQSLSPQQYIAFYQFFSPLIKAVDWYSRTAVEVSLSQLFVGGFVSLQDNTDLHWYGVYSTAKGSALGALAVTTIVTFWIFIGGVAIRNRRHGLHSTARFRAQRLTVLLMVQWLLLHIGSANSMFLYAGCFIPLMVLIAGIELTAARYRSELAVWSVAPVVFATSWVQMNYLRNVLGAT
ncbi:hypothetical protein [Aquabacterium sp. J223]|uniref:hypothetical protein n=1 Tax=Aquabacterium sp. J223 TaxID=2898431 RepID=UPI0021ADCEF4|nr:hypothetical protein [Aquabacterium sp. J223]UUX94188.1 hypothetical protein LRS07_12675 [Aquabacterium sp. J223]